MSEEQKRRTDTTDYLRLEIKSVGDSGLLFCALSPDIKGLMVAGRSLREVLNGVPDALDEIIHACALQVRGKLEITRATEATPQDYRNAPSGIGPLASEWADKPHRLVYDMANEIERLRTATNCAWTQDREGGWDTACGNRFVVNDGLPLENDMTFCCYCGKPLCEIGFVEEPVTDE